MNSDKPQPTLVETGKGIDVLWQVYEKGDGEQAILIRDWNGYMVELRQAENIILINKSSIKVLVKLLERYEAECKVSETK